MAKNRVDMDICVFYDMGEFWEKRPGICGRVKSLVLEKFANVPQVRGIYRNQDGDSFVVVVDPMPDYELKPFFAIRQGIINTEWNVHYRGCAGGGKGGGDGTNNTEYYGITITPDNSGTVQNMLETSYCRMWKRG